MKILNSLTQLILEWEQPYIYKVVFKSNDYEDLEPILKVFNNDLHQLFKFFDRVVPNVDGPSDGELFLGHIQYHWDEFDDGHLRFIIDALGGMRAYLNGSIDSDLLDKFVIHPYMEDIPDLTKNDDGRIILELMEGDEAKFFSGEYGRNVDCHSVAEQIFGEEGLEWEPYNIDEKLEDLIGMLSPENYIKLVRHIGIEFQNEEVDAWREEFEGVREDNGKVIITPSFMNGFLPDNESARYTLAVLIGNTPELDEIETGIQHAYSQAWNDVVMNQYYDAYNSDLNSLLGEPVGEGTTNTYKDVKDPEPGANRSKLVKVPVKYYDVTDLAEKLIVHHANDVDSPEYFVDMYVSEADSISGLPGLLCPSVDEYPDDEEEVVDWFQDALWDYL